MARDRLLFLQLSFSVAQKLKAADPRPKAARVGSTAYCLGMVMGENASVFLCG